MSLWNASGWVGDHADLWDFLAEEIKSRHTEVQVSWVKGHATRLDIQRGRSSQLDKWGNDGADALAVAGADMHCVPSELVQDARSRKAQAKIVQGMMIAVLEARFRAERAQATTEGDRGSDLGDIDTENSDNEDLCTDFIENLDDELDNGDDTLSGVG